MRKNHILVLTKQPGKLAELEPFFENKLEAFQEFVGGYIETFTLQNDMVVICNEEGRLLDMERNVMINGVDFVGPVIIAGVKGDEFSSIKAHLVPKVWKLLEEGGSL